MLPPSEPGTRSSVLAVGTVNPSTVLITGCQLPIDETESRS